VKPLITGTLIVTGFLTLVIWLDRRHERKKKEQGAGEAETPPRRNPSERVQAPHRPHPTEEEHRSNRETHWHRQIQTERLALGLSAIALATAVVGAVFLWSQTKAAWQAVSDAKIVADIQHGDTVAALTLAQRAFVVPNNLSITPLSPDGKTAALWVLVVTLENAGNTPTQELKVRAGIFEDDLTIYKSVPNLRRVDPDLTEVRIAEGDEYNWVLGPKHQVPVPAFLIEEGAAQQLRDDTLAVYVIGVATYFDTVGGKERHKTKFCFNISGWTGSADNVARWGTRRVALPRIPNVSSRPCFHNNCTDKDCGEEQQFPVFGGRPP
jgi:hypothetical protein